MTFRRALPNRPWRLLIARAGLALCIVAGLVVASTQLPSIKDPLAEVRADAHAAIEALEAGDLVALETRLAANRANADFAYFFTSRTTPRALGDALASVASGTYVAPLKADIDPHAYDVTLTDLAGTLGLATFGTGNRSLPVEWSDDFITASTTPEVLYGNETENAEGPGQDRVDQDVANKQNLLLLLSRGYWSTEFLEAVTDAYWYYDHEKGDAAWPGTPYRRVPVGFDSVEDAKYAPAPSGRFLTDGILALTAALTANPGASAWAFTGFQPGTEKIDGTDYAIGKFTHYLLFEHRYPESSDFESLGMTATLTALSSAIDATNGAGGANVSSGSDDEGPTHDSVVLQTLAQEVTEDSGCSWNPIDYWHCAVDVVEAVLHWIRRWGHLVLDILAVGASTVAGVAVVFVPPPFGLAVAAGAEHVAVAAASINATWYVIEGDYTNAGLSLAAAAPGIGFARIAKYFKAGIRAEQGAVAAVRVEKAAGKADEVARVSNEIRVAAGAENTMARLVSADTPRPNLRVTTKAQIREAAPKNADGDFIDPRGKVISKDGEFHYGHRHGYEARCAKQKAISLGWTVQQYADYFNDPTHFQIEDPSTNLSHKDESDVCAA
ncbi:hypothetical protein ASD81_13145 [Nocardioides sp. Root614]|nr:hypothetical protein ASD81_13145 [Nocardioides sp. Root614]